MTQGVPEARSCNTDRQDDTIEVPVFFDLIR
jgi:hypothetical protein